VTEADKAIDYGGGPLLHRVRGVNARGLVIARYGADGGHRWSHEFGARFGSISVERVAADRQGNLFVGGATRGDVDFGDGPLLGGSYLAKFTPAGRLAWRANDCCGSVSQIALLPSGTWSPATTSSSRASATGRP